MKTELGEAIVAYIENTSQLLNDFHKEAEQRNNELESLKDRQFNKEALNSTLEKCAEAGFINSKDIDVISNECEEDPNRVLLQLNKMAESVLNSRVEAPSPKLGKGVNTETSGSSRSNADKALFSKIGLS